MTATFLLPDLGEGIHEAEILAVTVSVGQKVHEGEIILEIETDKAAVEIPSPYTGEIAEILIQVGDLVKVGEPLMHFHKQPAESGDRRSAEPAREAPPIDTETFHRQPVPASPSTRRLARELGIDLHEVKASGRGAVVTKEDVLSHSQQPHVPTQEKLEHGITPPPTSTAAATAKTVNKAMSTLPDFALWGPIERQPFRSIRRATANRMSSSWTQIPHVHCMDDVDITSLETFRQKHKAEIEAAGGRLTMTVFAMKAVATALKTYPAFNASLDLEHQEIIIKRYFHLGIAVDSEHGLTVPVIRDVDRKSIKELAIEVESAVKRARTGKLEREEMQGGSFTITNAGALGGNRFSAIINHPEVAILGMGQGRMQPAAVPTVRGGYEIVPRRIMPVVLCFDHRVVDGGDAIRFLKLIIDALQDPDELLMTMI